MNISLVSTYILTYTLQYLEIITEIYYEVGVISSPKESNDLESHF